MQDVLTDTVTADILFQNNSHIDALLLRLNSYSTTFGRTTQEVTTY